MENGPCLDDIPKDSKCWSSIILLKNRIIGFDLSQILPSMPQASPTPALGCPGVPWGALPDPPGDGLTVGFWWIYHDLSSGIDIWWDAYIYIYWFIDVCIICICIYNYIYMCVWNIYIYICVCEIYIYTYICEVIAIAWSDFPKLTY